jgi:hypothetical protein
MTYVAPNIPPSGTTFAQWQSGGASGHLENLITAFAATSAPVTAPTVSATGVSTAGGALAAGGYFCKFTETNGVGETTASPESAVFTVAAGNIPKVTFPALHTGNLDYNVYLTAANGATNTEVLYATGVSSATTALAIAAPSNSFAVAPPPLNTTNLTYTDENSNGILTALQGLRGFKYGNGEDAYRTLAKFVQDFNEGDPMIFRAAVQKLRHAHTIFLTLATLCNEAGVLLDANAGTLKSAATGIGARQGVRTWP